MFKNTFKKNLSILLFLIFTISFFSFGTIIKVNAKKRTIQDVTKKHTIIRNENFIKNKRNAELTQLGFQNRIPAEKLNLSPDTLSILFIGDVMMHKNQIDNARATARAYNEKLEYIFEPYFDKIAPLFKDSDMVVANMEFSLGGKPYSGYPSFSAPDQYPEYIHSCGVDIFLMANNHILDRNKKGLIRTLKIYDKMSQGSHNPETDEHSRGLQPKKNSSRIRYTGAGLDAENYNKVNPLIFWNKGIGIGLINSTYGTNYPIAKEKRKEYPRVAYFDYDQMRNACNSAKAKKCDFLIAAPHWGTEYHLLHSESQRKQAYFFAEQGVDAIIGAHPHVVQDSTIIKRTRHTQKMISKEQNATSTCFVYYSLGNAVSNMSARNTQIELAVRLKFTIDKFGNKKMLPPENFFLWCSKPGGYCNGYTVLLIKEMIGKRNEWKNPADYDKMLNSYYRVKTTTKIKD